MAKMGKMDKGDLRKLERAMKKLSGSEKDAFFQACAKELAARLLRLVIKDTPTGDYPKASGKKGGTLKRGWTGEKRSSAIGYARSMPVKHDGGMYTVEIINPVEYAAYVEFGHRKSNGTGWVNGQFMLTLSEQKLRSIAPKVLEKKLYKFMEEVFK